MPATIRKLIVKPFGAIINSDRCQRSWNRPIHETAQHHDGFGTVYKFKTGNVSILSPAGPRISIRLRSSSTVAQKTGHNLLLGFHQDAVLCSTLSHVI